MAKEISAADWLQALGHCFWFQAQPSRARNPVRALREALDRVWNYGECVAAAEGYPLIQQAWRDLQEEELEAIKELRQVIFRRVGQGEFFQGL